MRVSRADRLPKLRRRRTLLQVQVQVQVHTASSQFSPTIVGIKMKKYYPPAYSKTVKKQPVVLDAVQAY
jgi:hypothetical protein